MLRIAYHLFWTMVLWSVAVFLAFTNFTTTPFFDLPVETNFKFAALLFVIGAFFCWRWLAAINRHHARKAGKRKLRRKPQPQQPQRTAPRVYRRPSLVSVSA